MSASSGAENGKEKKLKVERDLVPACFSSVRRSWLRSDVRLLLERDGEPLGVNAAQMRQAADLFRHHTA